MIEEQFVSFETAKMLKEAGFDCKVHKYFYRPRLSGKTTEIFAMPERNANKEARSVSRPTQALAARWMREEHKLHIVCETLKNGGWFYCITKLNPYEDNFVISKSNMYSFEESLEAALREALRLIIKNKEDEKDNVQ